MDILTALAQYAEEEASVAVTRAASLRTLAENLRDASAEPAPPSRNGPLDPAAEHNLGSLQLQIVKVPGLKTEDGLKTSEITSQIGRGYGDEPNVYLSLKALVQRKIVELIPGKSPQRWRLTRKYRLGV